DPSNFTFPFGTHICIVEVDTETGSTSIAGYYGVDDCGTIINPTIVDGQMHGGIAQGIGQALYEEAVYDDSGTLVSAAMSEYLIPGALELPEFTLGHTTTPSPVNALGAKGVGESGSIASTLALLTPVLDAVGNLEGGWMVRPGQPTRVGNSIQPAR